MDNKANISSSGKRFIVIFLLVIVVSGVWYMFLSNEEIDAHKVSELMVGEWIRSDGPYTIKIIAVQDKGVLQAEYYNPGPIHVGRSDWRIKEGELQIYVELQDKNYPGSAYELTYNDDKLSLT